MIKLSNRPFWQTPIAPALLVLLLAGLGRFSAGFGMMLIGIMAVATLLIMACGLMAINHFGRIPQGRLENGITIAIMAAAVGLLFASDNIRDQGRFTFWSSSHRRILHQALPRDGLIPEWSGARNADGSGSVLAIDTRDALATPDGAEDWRARTGWPCRIVSARRMSARVYVVIADRCGS